ncbi:hypothetical protein [Massilia sp. erpn]|uniref:hypothetical protein n=1 Tax=Massilia sp. erpn TaxID=2738142 RepID=UPI002102AA30|nr:hypothetical protein [Massilia sp. erpn]UTY59408.1 hypothetical protein HPQ68_20870 [Massilia sp. erpn]
MSLPFESVVIYLLGFVGLAAAGLVPYRSWLLMIEVPKGDAPQGRKRAVLVVAALISAAALWGDVQIVARVFACLTEAYCGPGVASGWMYLAMLGVVYVAFEVVSYVLRRALRGSKANV